MHILFLFTVIKLRTSDFSRYTSSKTNSAFLYETERNSNHRYIDWSLKVREQGENEKMSTSHTDKILKATKFNTIVQLQLLKQVHLHINGHKILPGILIPLFFFHDVTVRNTTQFFYSVQYQLVQLVLSHRLYWANGSVSRPQSSMQVLFTEYKKHDCCSFSTREQTELWLERIPLFRSLKHQHRKKGRTS